MAYTTEQQERIDAAQAKVNAARSIYEAKAGAYASYASGITCYDGGLPTVDEVKTKVWTPNRNTCSAKGGACNQKSKNACEVNVDHLNSIEVPQLRAAWQNYNTALTNLTTVTNQVIAESAPATQQQTTIAIAAANERAKIKRAKILWFSLITLILLLAGIYIDVKTNVKRAYIIGTVLALVVFFYFILGVGQDETV